MAPKAELPATVKGKFQRISRMGKGWSMTVLTFNISMPCGSKRLHLRYVAGHAEFPASIFYRKILPFFNIGLPVPAICIPPFMNSEIRGYPNTSGD